MLKNILRPLFLFCCCETLCMWWTSKTCVSTFQFTWSWANMPTTNAIVPINQPTHTRRAICMHFGFNLSRKLTHTHNQTISLLFLNHLLMEVLTINQYGNMWILECRKAARSYTAIAGCSVQYKRICRSFSPSFFSILFLFHKSDKIFPIKFDAACSERNYWKKWIDNKRDRSHNCYVRINNCVSNIPTCTDNMNDSHRRLFEKKTTETNERKNRRT